MVQIQVNNERKVSSPTLNTVLMVEDSLRNSRESIISIAELKRQLPKQINHNVLMVILEYLEQSGKILVGLKGISWIYTDRKILNKLINSGTEL